MKINTVGSIAFVVLFGVLSANAVVIFSDTFDAEADVWDNLNTELPVRQAAGITNSTYTLDLQNTGVILIGPAAGIATTPPLTSPILIRANFDAGTAEAPVVELDTDFGSSLVGEIWTFSFIGNRGLTAANSGWIGFAIGNPTNFVTHAGIGLTMNSAGGGGIWLNGVRQDGNLPHPSYASGPFRMTVNVDERAGTVQMIYDDLDDPNHDPYDMGTFSFSFADNDRYFDFRNFTAESTPSGFVDFRIDDVEIVLTSEPLPPPPIGVISTEVLSTGLALTWASTNGFNYAVQSKDDLVTGSWTNHVTNIPGVAGDLTVTTAVDQAQSFYRVVVEE